MFISLLSTYTRWGGQLALQNHSFLSYTQQEAIGIEESIYFAWWGKQNFNIFNKFIIFMKN